MDDRIIENDDNNIQMIRQRYPGGLHFVVGDTHGEQPTLSRLMDKIRYEPDKDHIYFLGDYNGGRNPTELLKYISQFYQEDLSLPGFHLIRGNHERELYPLYKLDNLPDIIVVRGKFMDYFLVHAGMVNDAFLLIRSDMNRFPEANAFAYALKEETACHDAPFRQIVWSRKGLYSQSSFFHVWPPRNSLLDANACIIHGHTPFFYLKKDGYFSYGSEMLFWAKQRIWFAEDLQSFNIDSNMKGLYAPEDQYCGLACICLEILEEIAGHSKRGLTRDEIRRADNFVFSETYTSCNENMITGDIKRVLYARPCMKTIGLNAEGKPYIPDQ